VFLLFMTQENALQRFQNSPAGQWARRSVTLLTVGANRADDHGDGAAAGGRLRAVEPRPDGRRHHDGARVTRLDL